MAPHKKPSQSAETVSSVTGKGSRIGYNFKRMRADRGWSVADLAEEHYKHTGRNIEESYIRQIEAGLVGFGKRALEKWSAIFNVDLSEFYKAPFDEMSEKGVPVIAYISAGEGIVPMSPDQYAVGQGFEYLPLPPGYTQEQAEREGIYAVKVKGDSMLPVLRDGWRLYIKPNPDKSALKTGDLVIFKDADGVGWAKEIELVNDDTIVFRSVGQGPTLIKKKEEISVIDKIYLIKP